MPGVVAGVLGQVHVVAQLSALLTVGREIGEDLPLRLDLAEHPRGVMTDDVRGLSFVRLAFIPDDDTAILILDRAVRTRVILPSPLQPGGILGARFRRRLVLV